MTLRLLDLGEEWLTEAKVKINAALTYLDGLQASVTAEIAAAFTAHNADAAAHASLFSGKAALQTYTEGTFTPAITFGGGATGITYSFQTATYTRIGRAVFIEIQMLLTNKGSSVGNAQIGTLPFTVPGSQALAVMASGMTSGVGDTFLSGEFAGASTNVNLYKISSGSRANLTDADFTNSSLIRVAGVYRV